MKQKSRQKHKGQFTRVITKVRKYMHFYVSANMRNGLALSKVEGSGKSREILLYL